jgi:methyl-galactoside transport system permease protein
MTNPVKSLQRTAAERKKMDQRDKKQFWSDLILNNALYILMAIFVIYTAIEVPNFMTLGSLANLITQVAAYLPLALGIAGCIVLTGTDLSAGRVVGLTAAIAGVFMQKADFANKMFKNLPEVSWWWIGVTLLTVVLIGAVIGLVDGFFVANLIFCSMIADNEENRRKLQEVADEYAGAEWQFQLRNPQTKGILYTTSLGA